MTKTSSYGGMTSHRSNSTITASETLASSVQDIDIDDDNFDFDFELDKLRGIFDRHLSDTDSEDDTTRKTRLSR